MRLQKTLPLLQHQHVEKPAVVLFHLLFQISKEKLLCLLQSLPTLLSLYHEGFACSHLGVSSIWFVSFHLNRDTPSLLLHTTPYTTRDVPHLRETCDWGACQKNCFNCWTPVSLA